MIGGLLLLGLRCFFQFLLRFLDGHELALPRLKGKSSLPALIFVLKLCSLVLLSLQGVVTVEGIILIQTVACQV